MKKLIRKTQQRNDTLEAYTYGGGCPCICYCECALDIEFIKNSNFYSAFDSTTNVTYYYYNK